MVGRISRPRKGGARTNAHMATPARAPGTVHTALGLDCHSCFDSISNTSAELNTLPDTQPQMRPQLVTSFQTSRSFDYRNTAEAEARTGDRTTKLETHLLLRAKSFLCKELIANPNVSIWEAYPSSTRLRASNPRLSSHDHSPRYQLRYGLFISRVQKGREQCSHYID